MATGMIGPEQLERVDHLLAEVARDDAFRVVLMHHPPLPLHGGVGLKRLIDAAAFRDILRRHGADLVLFGHIHVKTDNWLDGPQHPIPAVSVASASSTDRGDAPAHYHLFRIDKDAGRWRCEMVTRGFTSDNSGVVELGRRLLVPTPADQ
jgi:3',5'-cyclic AMP phosphodiesterase CpdA